MSAASNQHRLYYLQHLGVVPLISRRAILKLMVFSSQPISGATETLLANIVLSLNISGHEWCVIDDGAANLEQLIQHKKPQALLVFGLEHHEELNRACPLISAVSLEHLLHHPQEKKQFFQQVSTLKQVL